MELEAWTHGIKIKTDDHQTLAGLQDVKETPALKIGQVQDGRQGQSLIIRA